MKVLKKTDSKKAIQLYGSDLHFLPEGTIDKCKLGISTVVFNLHTSWKGIRIIRRLCML